MRQARKKVDESGAADSATEDDLETRAAALGLHEVERRVWKETALPPTPSAPSPTVSPPSSPKARALAEQQAELTARQAAAKLEASLQAACINSEPFAPSASFEGSRSVEATVPFDGSRSCDSRCDSDSDADPTRDLHVAIAAWEANGGGGHFAEPMHMGSSTAAMEATPAQAAPLMPPMPPAAMGAGIGAPMSMPSPVAMPGPVAIPGAMPGPFAMPGPASQTHGHANRKKRQL